MGWLITAGILVLLSLLPLGVSIIYDSNGTLLRLVAGPFRIQLYPTKKKEAKPKKEKASKPKKKKTAAVKSAPKHKKGGNISDFLPFVELAISFLRAFHRKLRVSLLELHVMLAGGDPCDLAVNYGKACAKMAGLWPVLEELFIIKKRDVQIQCDFEASQTLITARLDLTVTLGRLLSLMAVYGCRSLKEIITIINKRKGGAVT